MKIFLKIKNWQLFLLFVAPFMLPFLLSNDYHFIVKITVVISFVALPYIIFLIWFYSIGNFLGKLEETSTYKPRKLFNYNILVVFLYITFIYLIAFIKSDGSFSTDFVIASTDSQSNPLFTGPFAAIIMLISLYIIFAVLYNFYFIAKYISFYKNNSKKWIYFFLTWFFPLGLWFIQPIINKLYIKHNKGIKVNLHADDEFSE